MRYFFLVFIALLLLNSCGTQRQAAYSLGGLSPSRVAMDSLVISDASTDVYISTFRDSVTAKMSKVIGYADVPLTLSVPESPLSNFVADLMLSEAVIIAQNQGLTVPVLAIVNIKGLRTQLPQGNLTVGNIYQLMPFENEMVMVELSGNEVLDLYKHMVTMGGDGIGGGSFKIKDGKVIDAMVGGEPVDANRTYCIATSDYLANAGDKYYVFSKSKQVILGITLRDIIMNHVIKLTEQGKTINSSTDKRISYVN